MSNIPTLGRVRQVYPCELEANVTALLLSKVQESPGLYRETLSQKRTNQNSDDNNNLHKVFPLRNITVRVSRTQNPEWHALPVTYSTHRSLMVWVFSQAA